MASTSDRTWEVLQDELQQTAKGRALNDAFKARQEGLVPHTDAKVRHFGEGRETPRVKLYRDQAAWCPYCQKVWLLLEEKRLDYAVEKVPMRSYGIKPREFLAKCPRGLLPAVEIDGRLMTESLDIMFTIESTFRDNSRLMFPPQSDKLLYSRAVKLLELERAVFGAWCSYLFRPEVPIFGSSLQDFESSLRQVDDELAVSTSDWFLPYDHPTIVDMQYVSHIERMVASVYYYKGLDIRGRFSNIDSWLSAFERLPHYMATKGDFYTHCLDIPPQYGEPFPSQDSEAAQIRKLIDPVKARLPVVWDRSPEPRTESQASAPEEEHRIEAVWKLASNHAAVARFCSRAAGRGVGDWGAETPMHCKLADPVAEPNDEIAPYVETVLRALAALMIDGATDVSTRIGAEAKAVELRSGVPPGGWGQVARCLAYLRDRVGVPRDMQMPAAKILRAYLGEAVAALRE